ncbi:MAG: glycosyltransferase family 4 protein [Rhodoplanes sp.]|uniref:glycosyltransferase family 4 protein n=1 Tax=Rhodoplanes sp. TaxID=1968906 RepID=UPI0018417AD3|nr:glycosyltransferase family 4 protein [Rhodoplanes sp.]NVO15187.1 glycosyltransferase family 4 protein [Rhodoplanes sp.]
MTTLPPPERAEAAGRPLRLLMVTHFFESHRGGIEIVAGRLARELAGTGIAVTWLATDDSPPPAAEGVRTVPVGAANLVERAIGVPFPVPGLPALRTIAREVAAADVVVVHDALYLTSLAAVAAARHCGTPVMVVQHIGVVPYRNPLLRAAMTLADRLVARPLLARADQTVFISETTARHFAGLSFRAPPALIFNGVDTDVFAPAADEAVVAEARRGLGLPGDGKIALFVGRFVEKKGIAALVSMARLRPDVTFAFAGWGPLDPGGAGQPNVRVFGSLSGAALAPLYRASDCLVLPSTGEGFPLVVQEALACGLPVLCGEDSARADPAAERFLTGVPVTPDDPAATAERFAAALDRLLAAGCAAGDRDARAAFARDRYAWDRTAARHAMLVRRLATRRAAPTPSGTPAVAG